MTEIEKLPRLIDRAIKVLERATTSAEILEAQEQAGTIYTTAKRAARLNKIKDAHGSMLNACHKMMGDALVIEARAQCRLADEYDAAQERGEVKGHGNKKSDIPKENITSTVTDIGLTSKQVHAARAIRNAEKEKPGVVRKAVEEKLQENQAPTRADVKRAIQGKPAKTTSNPKGSRKGKSVPDSKVAQVGEAIRPLVLAGKPISQIEWAEKLGVGTNTIQRAVLQERARLEVLPEITPEMLSMSAQQKFDAAIKQHKQRLDQSFEQRVLDEIKKRMDEIILPHWRKQIGEAKKLFDKRKALMDKGLFNTIRRALHSDSRNSISDKKLDEAFDSFMGLEKYLLNEKDSPTEWPDLPSSAEDWEKMRTKPSRPSGPTAVRPR